MEKVGNRPPGDCVGDSRLEPLTGFQSVIADLPPGGRQLPFLSSILPIFRRYDRFFQKDRYIFSFGSIYVSTVLNDISDITVTAVKSVGFM